MTSPPHVAAARLALLLPPSLRDAVMGDLAEEHEARAAARDAQRAHWSMGGNVTDAGSPATSAKSSG